MFLSNLKNFSKLINDNLFPMETTTETHPRVSKATTNKTKLQKMAPWWWSPNKIKTTITIHKKLKNMMMSTSTIWKKWI